MHIIVTNLRRVVPRVDGRRTEGRRNASGRRLRHLKRRSRGGVGGAGGKGADDERLRRRRQQAQGRGVEVLIPLNDEVDLDVAVAGEQRDGLVVPGTLHVHAVDLNKRGGYGGGACGGGKKRIVGG